MGRRRSLDIHILKGSKNKKLSSDDLATVYSLVEDAVNATDLSGKSTDEIFGEIYTRFRTEAKYSNRYPELNLICKGKLKNLDWTEAGKQMGDIIKELYVERVANDPCMLDLELCHIIAQSCVSDAKQVIEQSETVISNLEKIDQKLNGEESNE